MKLILFTIVLFFSCFAEGQNMCLNGGFESGPWSTDQLSAFSIYETNELRFSMSNGGIAAIIDYFDIIPGYNDGQQEIINLSAPDNYFGSQMPFESIVYMGLWTFDAGLDITLGSGFHADYGSTFTAKICGCKENSRYALNSNNHNQFVREPSEKFAALSNLKNQFDYVDRVEVQIFPNPASNILNINSNVEIIRVELIDNLGFAIYSMEVHGLNRVQTDVSNIESGLYQVRIITADNSVFVKSFVKTN